MIPFLVSFTDVNGFVLLTPFRTMKDRAPILERHSGQVQAALADRIAHVRNGPGVVGNPEIIVWIVEEGGAR
jgi:hypothetical protein